MVQQNRRCRQHTSVDQTPIPVASPGLNQKAGCVKSGCSGALKSDRQINVATPGLGISVCQLPTKHHHGFPAQGEHRLKTRTSQPRPGPGSRILVSLHMRTFQSQKRAAWLYMFPTFPTSWFKQCDWQAYKLTFYIRLVEQEGLQWGGRDWLWWNWATEAG